MIFRDPRIRPAFIACFGSVVLLAMFATFFIVMSQNVSAAGHDELIQPSLVYDCSEGADYRLWSPGQKDFCCAHTGRACPHADERYDCDQGYGHWKNDWSRAHQRFCCYKHQRACKVKVVHETKFVPVYHTKFPGFNLNVALACC